VVALGNQAPIKGRGNQGEPGAGDVPFARQHQQADGQHGEDTRALQSPPPAPSFRNSKRQGACGRSNAVHRLARIAVTTPVTTPRRAPKQGASVRWVQAKKR